MASIIVLLGLFLAAAIAYKILSWNLKKFTYRRQRDRLGCLEPQGKYPHKDPILGLDLLFKGEKQRANSTYLREHQALFQELGKTHEIIFAGNRMIRTMDVKNIQAVLGTEQKSYGLEPLRTGLAEPLFGRGINTTDGDYWHHCRDLIKPTFSRVDVCDAKILEMHFQDLLALLPRDFSTVDLQPLFSRLFLDTTTGLLFGESARTLSSKPDPAGEQFVEDFDYALTGLGTRVRLGPLKFLHRDRAWFQAIDRVHTFVQKYIDSAFETKRQKEFGVKGPEKVKERDGTERNAVLLPEIVRDCKDPLEVRSQIMAVFMPSRETVSFLASNVLWAIARYPAVQERLRAELTPLGNKLPSFEAIRSAHYLQWVINEAHRMWPVSAAIPRTALVDAVLPTGGGPDGTAQILVQKGDWVMCDQYLIHHNAEYWGSDHDQFRPERWDGLRPLWNFGPFGGGPRTCPAQHMVHTEVGYVITRLLQEFSSIEPRDDKPWTEQWLIDMCNKHGCQVSLTPSL